MEGKGIYPCVKCAERTFKYKIAPKLKEWGYVLPDTNKKFNDLDVIITNCILRGNCVDICNIEYVKRHDRYLCRSVSEFLEATKALAIKNGWFKEEVISKKETPTENKKERWSIWTDKPTLSVARKQFENLTKYYTIEQLSKPQLPRSWEEYLEQNPIINTTELDKKMAALRKLVLIHNKWVEEWTPAKGNNVFSVSRTHEWTVITNSITYLSCLSFPTREMAENFLNTFSDLIREVGDLI